MPWKTGEGGGAQSNFPTCDHQNIFNLILIWSYNLFIFKYLREGGGGGGGMRPLATMDTMAMLHVSLSAEN